MVDRIINILYEVNPAVCLPVQYLKVSRPSDAVYVTQDHLHDSHNCGTACSESSTLNAA